MLALAAMSIGANYAAVKAAIAVSDLHLGWLSDPIVGGIAGLVGSVLLAIAVRISLRTALTRTLLPFAIVGSIAGAVFFLLPHPAIGYMLWQSAIAVVLARSWADSRTR
jgi:hypothetical protein